MTKKADLLKEAQARNLDVTDKNTVAEIKDALNNDTVVVNENRGQEDVDGYERTGGKSYGVAPNDPESENNDGSDTDK